MNSFPLLMTVPRNLSFRKEFATLVLCSGALLCTTRDFFVLLMTKKWAKLYLEAVRGSYHYSHNFLLLSSMNVWSSRIFPFMGVTKIMTFFIIFFVDSMISWGFSRHSFDVISCKTKNLSVQMTLCTKSSSWARSHLQKWRRYCLWSSVSFCTVITFLF